ncbi:MAG: YdcF family protein [Mycobacteriaceae bacterium]
MDVTPADQVALDVIASWLRLEDDDSAHVDVTLLFGGSLPDAWDTAADALRRGSTGTLVLVGGVGHTTDALRAVLRSGGHEADAATEADLMAAYLRATHGIDDVLLERRSTNCGTNVSLAREVVQDAGLAPRTVALVQDPTMQRRMDAVARHVWPDVRLVNRPGPDSRGWPLGRWTELVVGEVPRLRDDAHGYGPRGRGFLAHVEVPAEVEAAYDELLRTHPGWGRPAVT